MSIQQLNFRSFFKGLEMAEFGWYLIFTLYLLFYIFHICWSRINEYMSSSLVLFLVFWCYCYLIHLRKTDCVQRFGSLIEKESTRKKCKILKKREKKKDWKYFVVVLWSLAQPHEHMFLQKQVLLSLKQYFVILNQPESFTVFTK